jgi:hypothetical protein
MLEFDDVELLDAELSETRHFFFPERLDNPLLDTPLEKFRLALGASPTRKMSGKCKISREIGFLSSVRETLIKSGHKNLFFETWTQEVPVRLMSHLHNAPRDRVPKRFYGSSAYATAASATKTRLDRYLATSVQGHSRVSKEAAWYMFQKWKVDQLVNRRRLQSSRGSDELVSGVIGPYHVILGEQHVAVRFHSTVWLGSSDMFLALADIVRTRANVMAGTCLLDLEHLRDPILALWKWQEQAITRHGNAGFNIAKMTEALLRCAVSRISGGSYSSPDAYDRMIEKCRVKERKLGVSGDFLADSFDQVWANLSVHDVVELFGLNKCIGFPIVSSAAGGEKSRDQAKTPSEARPAAVEEAIWLYSHLTVKNYIVRKGKWPDMEFTSEGKTSKLYKLWKQKNLYLADGLYPLSDWENASSLDMYQFDYHEDYLELMKDKSCAPPRSAMKSFYDRVAADPGMRKVLINMLREPNLNTRELIGKFASDQLDIDLYNIILRAKEREHKVEPRMYCMLTFTIRLILAVIQENVKAGPFKDLHIKA